MIRSHAREFREAIFPFCNPPRVVSVRNGTYFWRNLTLPRCHLPRHDDSSLHRTEKKKKKKERRKGKNSTVFAFCPIPDGGALYGARGNRIGIRAIYNARGKVVEKFEIFCRPRGITRNHFFSNDFFVRPISRNDLSIYKRSARNKIALLLCLKIVWVISRERERRKNAITVPVY